MKLPAKLRRPSGTRSQFTIGIVLLLLLSFLAFRPASVTEAVGSSGRLNPETSETTTADPGPGGSVSPGATGPGTVSRQTRGGRVLECRAGANGGATDKGVKGDRISLAATNVRSGPGSSFLGSSYVGIQAVIRRVNAQGGICGRLLELKLIDDGWDAARGASFLANFAAGDYFALPVVPSSEGLTVAIRNGTIRSSGIPVIGTDGMLKEQYLDPWVWPVATATVSTMRVMSDYAKKKGACSFGIVFDSRYKFGKEGADAFKKYARTLPCVAMKAFVGIEPGRPDYSAEINAFNEGCNPCDFVAMLLEPGTAYTWVAGQPEERGFGRIVTAGAQPLFNERFARDCGHRCSDMLVWTGYNPPIGANAADQHVSQYVRDVRSIDPGVDVYNQFLEGSYLGMQVFVEALRNAGPNLTRAAVREAMNTMNFSSGLSGVLNWSPSNRFANCSAQAFRIVTSSGSFAGFAESGSGFIRDAWCGRAS